MVKVACGKRATVRYGCNDGLYMGVRCAMPGPHYFDLDTFSVFVV